MEASTCGAALLLSMKVDQHLLLRRLGPSPSQMAAWLHWEELRSWSAWQQVLLSHPINLMLIRLRRRHRLLVKHQAPLQTKPLRPRQVRPLSPLQPKNYGVHSP